MSFDAVIRVEDDLNQTVAISDVDEDQATVVPVIVHPTTDFDFGLGVVGCQFAAGVSPEHVGDPWLGCFEVWTALVRRPAAIQIFLTTEAQRKGESKESTEVVS